MQKKSKHTVIQSQCKNLSIQFSLDGFSFCIIDDFSKAIISFTEYTFEKTLPTPNLLQDKIIQIFAEDKDLQQDFNQITVIHQNSLATVVPASFFDEDRLKTYLDYNIKTLANDHIVYDEFEAFDAKNVYVPFVNVNNYLFQNFGSFEYQHHATVLIDKLIEQYKKINGKLFFVHVSNKDLDIVVIENGTLLLYNSFSFTSKEDFIYYILFVAEQLNMNPEEFILTFLGDIEKDSEIYEITYDYVRNIEFIKPKSPFFTAEDTFSNHSNYILLS